MVFAPFTRFFFRLCLAIFGLTFWMAPFTSKAQQLPNAREFLAGLTQHQLTPQEQLLYLTNWVYQRTPYGHNYQRILKECYGNPWFPSETSALEIDSLIETRNLKLICGGHATFMERMAQEVGFKAGRLNIGNPDFVTHVLTLVELPQTAKSKWVLLDANSNAVLTTTDTQLVDYWSYLNGALLDSTYLLLTVTPEVFQKITGRDWKKSIIKYKKGLFAKRFGKKLVLWRLKRMLKALDKPKANFLTLSLVKDFLGRGKEHLMIRLESELARNPALQAWLRKLQDLGNEFHSMPHIRTLLE